MSMQWERREQSWLVKWFKLKYKDILIVASANGGARDAKQAALMKGEGVCAGFPDLGIYKANRGYHGLFIEMKVDKTERHAKGVLSALQKERLQYLMDEGYYAIVCYGWLQGKEVIDWYLGES